MQTSRINPPLISLRVLLVACILLTGAISGAAESQNAIRVGGAVATPGDWDAARLAKDLAAELKPVEYESGGRKHVSRCVPLLALLKSAGIPAKLKMDPSADLKTKNLASRLMVVVTAKDGYAAAFSLAEILPAWTP